MFKVKYLVHFLQNVQHTNKPEFTVTLNFYECVQ